MRTSTIVGPLLAVVAVLAEPLFLTNLTEPFAVDASTLPNFPFDIGESYAGLLSISTNVTDDQKLWFWFVPSTNPAATDEVLIWFSGGPGCSGMTGMFYENGPFIWPDGTIEPIINPWAWTNLTNVLWIDQPVGAGYSTGVPNVSNMKGVAKQFLGFWENFVNTFALHNADVYIAGESYGGRDASYIGHAMLDKNDTEYFNLQSTMFVDALIADHQLQQDYVLVPYVEHFNVVLNLNNTYMDTIRYASSACGFDDYVAENLVFPGNPDADTTYPTTEYYTYDGVTHKCSALTESIKDALQLINPCFEAIHITSVCPMLFSSIGYPTFVNGGLKKRTDGAYVGEIYLNRDDVKTILNAELKEWVQCNQTGISVGGDLTSTQPILGNLPSLIERSKRTVITHGSLDMQLIYNGTLLAIQEMTWDGATGFSKAPSDTFIVPAFSEPTTASTGTSGSAGITITERGLTYVEVYTSGHEVPQYAPAASFRQLEFLLGRVDSLTDDTPFTTDT